MNEQGVMRMRSYCQKDKKKLRDGFTTDVPLEKGWLLRYLIDLEEISCGRWNHWAKVKMAGRMIDEPIPQIEWYGNVRNSPAWGMLDRALNSITKCGGWQGWSSFQNFDYLLDWILWGFGCGQVEQYPKEPMGCEGASSRLYQMFDLTPLLCYPSDYFGDILSENNFGRRSGFFPTPIDLCALMVKMQFDGAEDMRDKTVCDPALGTGRMLLAASNYSYRLYGNDISRTVLRAALVNGYLYSPWMVKPFDFWEKKAEITVDVQQVAPVADVVLKKPEQLELMTA
jgi:hypothetical protein